VRPLIAADAGMTRRFGVRLPDGGHRIQRGAGEMSIAETTARRRGRTGPGWPEACHRFARSSAALAGLLARHRLSWPRARVGERLRFEDGTTSRVFRETVLEAPTPEPALLIVQFRLRLLGRAPLPHRLFRAESIANTPLFAGFAGFRSKLWLCDADTGTYRGIYEWDGADRATIYAETLTMLLRLVSEPGTVRYRIVARTRRDEYLAHPASVTGAVTSDRADTWWRLRNDPAARDQHLMTTEKGSP
jgi:hypothetical protein